MISAAGRIVAWSKPVPGWPSQTLRIDRDDFDRVLAGLGVELRLPIPGGERQQIVLRFHELEDFHPDRIYERTEVFGALRDLRRQLNDPTTFQATVRQMGFEAGIGPEPDPHGPALGAPAPTPLRPRLLRRTCSSVSSQRREDRRGLPGRAEAGPWAAFLDRITAPYRVDAADPRQAEVVAGVDAATGQLMRGILHHPDFQALEAAWRSLHFLIRRLETDEQLTVSVLDVTKAELTTALLTAGSRGRARSDRLLVESLDTAGGEPWAVLVGDMTFEPTRPDVALLGRLAGLARRAGGPFLAAASPRFLGCDSLAAAPDPDDWRTEVDDPAGREAWEALRRHPDAAYLGLALPRFLLRLPYGRDDDPIESFDFEELAPDAGHGSYLWGNPSFLLAELLGQSFSRSGWELRPGEINEVGGLPLHVIRGADEATALPCAEVLLSDRAAEIILDNGLMPVLTLRDQDVVHIGRFQSIAKPFTPLAGRWHP